MSITLDQIAEYEERLRAEIVQRECLLAALGVCHTYSAKGQWPESLDLGSLASSLVRPARDLPAEPVPAPEPEPARPATPPPERYVHPELRQVLSTQPTDGDIVRWAISRMTDDYTVREIATLLERSGHRTEGRKISVVLTRLKGRGEIVEIKRGMGRIAARFRKPDDPIPLESIAA